jgi:hypothetical protein
MIGITTPAPWAPGHVVNEALYAIFKQLESNCSETLHLFVLPGAVSLPFYHVYSSHLAKYNIEVVTDLSKIAHTLSRPSTDSIISLSLSHSTHAKIDQQIDAAEHYRPKHKNPSAYETLSNGSLKEWYLSSNSMHFDINEYNHLFFKYANKDTLLPRVSFGSLDSFIPNYTSDKLALICLREHSANFQIGMTAADFAPVCAFLKHNGYTIVDVGHQAKTYDTELEKYDVKQYWRLDGKNFLTDIELFSKSSVFVGSGGIGHLAIALGIPTVWVGCFFPGLFAMQSGYDLPCRIRDRISMAPVSNEQALRIRLAQFDKSYDGFNDFSGQWTSDLHSNNYQDLCSDYKIERPVGINIAKTVRLLFEDLKLNPLWGRPNISSFNLVDLSGRRFVSTPLSPFF